MLAEVLDVAERHAREHVQREDYEGAMAALAQLRPAVDAFFDKVTVNADDPALARQPPAPPRTVARSHPRRGGFLEDRGISTCHSREGGNRSKSRG